MKTDDHWYTRKALIVDCLVKLNLDYKLPFQDSKVLFLQVTGIKI